MKKLIALCLVCGTLFGDTVALSSETNYAKQLSHAFTTVSKRAIPAVVYIQTEMHGKRYNGGGDPQNFFSEEFFDRFFGGPQQRQQHAPQRQSQGTGFIISDDGYILTNFHVVKDASKILVDLNDSHMKEVEAVLVGGDAQTDIAVLKIEGKGFPHLNFANSDDVEIGEWVLAVGNPFQLEATVTAGIVSAKGRNNMQITDLEDFIQTDASINPGNSGGPLINLDSLVVGMNTAIISKSGGYMGIGFAIPSNILRTVSQQLIKSGEVIRGFLGISLQPIDTGIAEALHLKSTEGALVAQVMKDSPAEKAGIEQGDVILEINRHKVKSPASLRNEILLMDPGAKAILKINRQGNMITVPVTIGSSEENHGMASERARKLGLEVTPLSPELASQFNLRDEEGVVVKSVEPGSPAQLAGIRRGALIMAVNHKKITTVGEFNEMLEKAEGPRVLLLINVKGMVRFFSLKVD